MADMVIAELTALRKRVAALEAVETIKRGAGLWTPTYIATTTPGSYTYATQYGAYRRLGDLVYVEWSVAISAITVAPVGSMEIAGLPFSVGGGGAASAAFGRISNLDYPAGALQILGLITGSTVRLFYSQDNAAVASYPAASFTNAAATIIGSAWYLI